MDSHTVLAFDLPGFTLLCTLSFESRNHSDPQSPPLETAKCPFAGVAVKIQCAGVQSVVCPHSRCSVNTTSQLSEKLA